MGPYDEVFAALDSAGVRYVVVGGVAVVLQGHPRMTVDLDLVIDLAEDQALRAVEALASLGLLPRLPVDARDFAIESKRRDWVETRNMQVFSFYDPTNPLREVNVFADYPLEFEELVADARAVNLNGRAVPVASIEHLIQMKQVAARPHDLAEADWSAATFAGLRAVTARAAAAATPQQRWLWLNQAMQLAAASGALDRVRAARHDEALAAWC